MRHDYPSFSIPSPIIKDADDAVEDALGSIITTNTLINSLAGDIEGVQELARAPDPSVVADAMKRRLEALWALSEAIGERMKNDIILLTAVVDQRNRASASAGAHN